MTASTAISSCLVCGSGGRDAGVLQGILRQCGSCGFVWTADALGPAEDLYDASYYREGGYEDYLVPVARRFEALRRVQWLRSFGHPATLVEAGSAAGFFVEAAGQAGVDARGVEVSDAAARYATDVLGVAVRQGRFETAAFDSPFDAVCAFHVLEHVERPRAFLDAAWNALVPGGLLALEVPNISSPAARRLGTAWEGLQPEYHRWHFDRASLTALVGERGFEVVGCDTASFRFYMTPVYRRRHARRLLPADVRNLRSWRLTHPSRGDLLRLVARRPPAGQGRR